MITENLSFIKLQEMLATTKDRNDPREIERLKK